jgi:hypothetical protein
MHIRAMFLLVASLPWIAEAGFDVNGRGARPIALSNAFVAVGRSPWSTVYNPAGLAFCNSFEGGLFLSPHQFGLKELRTISAAGVIPFGPGSAGIIFDQFGFDLYRETELAAGVGIMLDDGVAVGGVITIGRLALDRYGSTTIESYDLGALLEIIDGLRIGFDWKNITAATIAGTGETIPQVLAAGLCYDLNGDSRMSMEVEKDIRFPLSVRMGIEHSFLKVLTLRFGMGNNPDKFSCGLGVRVAWCELSYAGYSHPQLGWTHQIELSFSPDW